jgi:hypothetical protein
MADEYGIADTGHSMHAAFFDYDLDGDLDLYVLNNIISKEVPTNYRIKITDGTSINNDHLYQNLGNGKFKNVSKEAGILIEGYGLGIAVGDVNKDGYPDLYISNDYISNDLLYINQKNGTFKNEIAEYVSYQSRFSMGNDMADINNDGCLDIATMDMMPEQYFRKKQTINGNSYYVYINNEKYGYDPQYVRNMLQIHNGFLDSMMMPYSEIGQMAGVYQTEWSWSPLMADFDNDGDKDLFITNGFPKDLTDKDFTNYKAQVYGSVAGDAHMIERIPIVKVSNYAYENKGDLHFENQAKAWGMEIPSFSNGAAFADLDNDGDLDYVVNNINDIAFIYKNNTIGSINDNDSYLRIKLEGEGQNLASIGAKVELWCNGNYQYTEKYLSRGYISSVEPIVHFGLGKAVKNIDSIRITWPKGDKATLIKNVQPNQVLTLKETDAKDKVVKPFHHLNYLFSLTENIIDYKDAEKDYIDFFQGQGIIQHKFSQISPRISKGDLNGDGIDDVLIGASYNEPTRAFIRVGNKFSEVTVEGLTGDKKTQEADLIIIDIDQDNDNDVVVASGGYVIEEEDAYKHFVYRNQNGVFVQEELPIPSFPASVVKPIDFDHDGDLDLFIGARIKKWSFPLSLPSYLLVNDNGSFKSKPELTFDIGMVTDAVWSDYDGDGWEDLLVSRELNTIAILKNEKGKSLNQIDDRVLNSKHGFWYSICAGDFDNDGDDDYIVGNLGSNNRFTISDKTQFNVYAIDLDKNGFIDPVSTSYWKDINGEMQEYPVNYLDELAAQSPYFRKKFTSYTNFSYTNAKDIFNPDSIPQQLRFYANTDKSYVLWNDKGNFSWQELPTFAQVAPVKKMLVQDFDGDKFLDVLITGNDHSFDVSTGYYDASRGILLKGTGTKSFETLLPAKSGFCVRGQVESLVYMPGETPLILVGINKNKLETFIVNK